MISKDLKIINELGLHARASSKFTQSSGRFKSDITVSKNGKSVNGKSIMGLMMLAAAQGSTITISCSGEDESEAMDVLVGLVNNYFGEGK